MVVDYKTGRAPSERFERARMTGVHIYALLCERVLGRVPVEVRLFHLRDPVDHHAPCRPSSPSGASASGRPAVWQAIERACAREDFRPRPGPLCAYCNFQALCPAFGGSVPVVAEAS